MPIARYFVVVGSALAALPLIAGWSLPEPLPSFPDRPETIEGAPTEQLAARLPDEMPDQTRVGPLAKPNPVWTPIPRPKEPVLQAE